MISKPHWCKTICDWLDTPPPQHNTFEPYNWKSNNKWYRLIIFLFGKISFSGLQELNMHDRCFEEIHPKMMAFSYWACNVIYCLFSIFIVTCTCNKINRGFFFYSNLDRSWMDGRFVLEHTPHSLSASENTDWTVCGIFSGVGVSQPVSNQLGEKKSRCLRSPSAPRGPWGASSVARTRWTVCVDGTTPTPPHLAPSVGTTTVPRGTSPPIQGL